MSDLDCYYDGLDYDCCDCDCDFGGCLSMCISVDGSHSGGHGTHFAPTAAAIPPATAASAPSAIASTTASRHAAVLLAGVGVRGSSRGDIRPELYNIVAAGRENAAPLPLGGAGVAELVKKSAAGCVFPLDLNLAAGVRHQTLGGAHRLEATCPLALARFKKVSKCAV